MLAITTSVGDWPNSSCPMAVKHQPLRVIRDAWAARTPRRVTNINRNFGSSLALNLSCASLRVAGTAAEMAGSATALDFREMMRKERELTLKRAGKKCATSSDASTTR